MSLVRGYSVAGFAAFALVVGTPSLRAQSAQKLSVQASALYVGAYGKAYEGLSGGAGLEAQLRYTPSVWSFGGGFQISSHDLDLDEGGTEKVTLAGLFFEPRRVIDVQSSTFAPYVSARVAFLRQSIDFDVDGTKVSANTNGAQVNAGGGLLFRMSPRVNLDVGATYGLIRFDDVKVVLPGQGSVTVDGTSGNGQNLVLRLGLAIGLR